MTDKMRYKIEFVTLPKTEEANKDLQIASLSKEIEEKLDKLRTEGYHLRTSFIWNNKLFLIFIVY